MTHNLKALILDAATGFYTIKRYPLGEFFGPVDLGLHLAGKHNALSMGVGIFAGSIIPVPIAWSYRAFRLPGEAFMYPPWAAQAWSLTIWVSISSPSLANRLFLQS
jgi:hypothetical protein